jgi:hypothetical protein
VLARPRWRDQLIWQGGEIFYYASVWWYLGGHLEPGGGGDPGFYWLAIIVRMAAQLYLVAIVVRDIWLPEYDVVREVSWRDHFSWWRQGGPGQLALNGSPDRAT